MDKGMFAHRDRGVLFSCVPRVKAGWHNSKNRKCILPGIFLAALILSSFQAAAALQPRNFDPAAWRSDLCAAMSIAYADQPLAAARASAESFKNRFYPTNNVVLDGVKSQGNSNGIPYYEIWWHLEPYDLSFAGSVSSSRLVCAMAVELPSSLENRGKPRICNGTNPINAATGNKFQEEFDYARTGAGHLSFIRYYNSQGLAAAHQQSPDSGTVGSQWRNNYSRSIDSGMVVDLLELHRAWNDPTSPTSTITAKSQNSVVITLGLNRPDGAVLTFSNTFLVMEGILLSSEWSSTSSAGTLTTRYDSNNGTIIGFQYTGADDTLEVYDISGRLLTVSRRGGFTQTLSYNGNGTLSSVSDPFGHSLIFAYDSQSRVINMTDPAGNPYGYNYDSAGNLSDVTYPDQSVRHYLYEDSRFPHALTGIIDENGNRYATWQYDSLGRAVSSEHAGATDRTVLTYSNGGTSITNALGQSIAYRFVKLNGIYKIAAIQGGSCASCGQQAQTYTYDSDGNLSSSVDFNGNTTIVTYNARHLMTSRTEAVGTPQERTTTTEWHPSLHVPTRIVEPGKTTEYVYDGNGHILSQTETDSISKQSRLISYSYDQNKLLTRIDGPRTTVNDITSLTYDNAGNISEIVNALGHKQTVSAYNPHGQPLRVINANGLVQTFAYDARGRLLTSDSGGEQTNFQYDSAGNLKYILFADGSSRSFSYDAANRLLSISDSSGSSVRYTLDDMGNRIKEERFDANGTLGMVRSYAYDGLGRLAQETGAAAESTIYSYDANGNRLSVTDALGNTSSYTYDALNQLASIQNVLGGLIRYAYDGQGHILSLTDPNGNTSTFAYDGLGNRTAGQNPDRGLIHYRYDPAGNLISYNDANGNSATLQYDALNRVTKISYQNGLIETYSYDGTVEATGLLSSVTDAGGTTEWQYDNHKRVVQRNQLVNGIKLTTGYRYDTTGQLQQMIYPSGTVVDYRYAGGRLDQFDIGGQPAVLGIQYNATGLPRTWVWGNGLTLADDYDRNGRLVSHSIGSNAETLTYDLLGNITRISNPQDTVSYGYDALNRLVSAAGNVDQSTYSYDANGNRTSLTANSVQQIYDHALTSNRLMTITGTTTRQLSYDANGNILDDGRHQYTYDSRNHVLSVDNGAADYRNNALGERTAKSRGAAMPGSTALLDVSFDGIDGTVVDDQTDGLWKGADRSMTDSAVIQNNQLVVNAGERIRTKPSFTDKPGNSLTVSGELAIGVVKLKKVKTRAGIKIRYNGIDRVAITTGAFDDAALATKTVYRLSTSGQALHFTMHLGSGTTSVSITDGAGQVFTTDPEKQPVLNSGDRYRLVIKAIKVKRIPRQAQADNIAVNETSASSGSEVTYFAYDDTGRLLGEYDNSGAVLQEFFYIGGRPVALTNRGTLYYVHTDHLGTPQQLTDANGKTVWTAQYAPFGNATINEDPDGDGNTMTFNLRFPGQYYDAETGLHYNYHRYYDPNTGRYITSDPIGLGGGFNTYAYVFNNPINSIDPLGLFCLDRQTIDLISTGLGTGTIGSMYGGGVPGFIGGFFVGLGTSYISQQRGLDNAGGAAAIGFLSGLISSGGSRGGAFAGAIASAIASSSQHDKSFNSAITGSVGGTIGGFSGELFFPSSYKNGAPLFSGVRGGIAGIVGGFVKDIVREGLIEYFECTDDAKTHCKQ